MKLTTRGRYGTRALLELALHWGEGPVSLKDIAQRQEISLPYLEHLINTLTTAGLVRSTRGPQGGVWLARPPREIKLSEVIHILEGSIAPADCVNSPDECPRSELCVTRDVWCEIDRAINEILENTTLQNLVKRRKDKDLAKDSPFAKLLEQYFEASS